MLAQLAGVTADGSPQTLVLRRNAAFDVHRLGDGDVAVTAAINRRNLIADQAIGQAAQNVHAPIGRVAEFGAVDQAVFHISVTGIAVDEGNPRHVGGAEANRQRGVNLGLQEGVLDVEALADFGGGAQAGRGAGGDRLQGHRCHGRGAGRRRCGRGIVGGAGFADHIADVGQHRRREHRAELVVNANIQTLDVKARARVGVVAAIGFLRDGALVKEHIAAQLGVAGPFHPLIGPVGGVRRRLGGGGGGGGGGQRLIGLGRGIAGDLRGQCDLAGCLSQRGAGLCRTFYAGLQGVELRLKLADLFLRNLQLLGAGQAFFGSGAVVAGGVVMTSPVVRLGVSRCRYGDSDRHS